jgi:hypothetical protein
MRKGNRVCVSATAIIICCSSSSWADNDCPVVFNETTLQQDSSTYQAAKRAICSNEIKTTSQARSSAQSAGLGAGIFEDILKLNLSGSYSSAEQDFSNWQKAFCASSFDEVSDSFHQILKSKTLADPDTLRACIERKSVYQYFVVNSTHTAFTYEVGVAGKDKLLNASVGPASAVSNCSVDNPFDLDKAEKKSGRDISGTPQTLTCDWDSTQNVIVKVKLANGGARSQPLDALPAAAPIPPAKEFWCQQSVRFPIVVTAQPEGKPETSGANTSWVGTTGESRKLFNLKIDFARDLLPIPPHDLGLRYSCHVGGHNWRPWKAAGQWCSDIPGGRIEAIAIELIGDVRSDFKLTYSCHVESLGNVGPSMLANAPDGVLACGSVGASKRMEALYVDLQSTGDGKGPACK